MIRPNAVRRGAFTLIELLVVIAIISILAALTMAAVQKVRERGRDVQARSDITQLEAAVSAFKSKFSIYPPCYGGNPTTGGFRLQANYSTFGANEPEVVFLKQMFPRMDITNNGYAGANITLDPNQCLVFFLSGGASMSYAGFSTNPARPFAPPLPNDPSSSRLNGGPFFEGFTTSRMGLPSTVSVEIANLRVPKPTTPGSTSSSDAQPWFVDPWGSPYLYLASDKGNDFPFDGAFKHPVAAVQTRLTNVISTNIYDPWVNFRPARDSASSNRFFNVKTFQVYSAGRNRIFGTGGAYTAGSGVYALNKDGGDDWSNYQQTPLGVTD